MVVYALTAVRGQFDLLGDAVPIEQALEDSRLTDEQREKLAFVVRARDYAAEVVGLNVGGSYSTFVNLGEDALAWNLSASYKDRLEAYYWNVPIVGWIPYLGFFQFDQAVVQRDRLVAKGFDTLIYEVDAYSTLGILPDPVASTLLNRDLPSLADTIIHELLHNTIFRAQDTVFNESLATFVGRTAGIEFLQHEFGADAPIITQALHSYEDSDRFNVFLQELVVELNALYESELTSDEKIELREGVFEAARVRYASEVLPLMHDQEVYGIYATFAFNNAFVLLNVRYNSGLDVYQAIYDLTGRDWGQALRLYSDAALQNDPEGYLRDIAAAAAVP